MIKLKASAKINLCLDILKRTASEYHEIQTVFHEIPELADELEIYETKESNHTSTPGHLIPQAENLAYKALKLLKKTQNIKKNAKIVIHKCIPIASGLGGASSDAAATLKGLNKLWNLNLSTEKLLDLASRLGADVPFFILGGTALGEHFGEKLTPLLPIKCVKFEIDSLEKWPKTSLRGENKTSQMYASLDLSKCGKNTEKTKRLLEGIEKQDPNLIIQNLHNDFETLTPPPKNHHLTGSGPATFVTRY
jgi:4-diphosphocytidyl-2-C-methyl-D-erythritol kinase